MSPPHDFDRDARLVWFRAQTELRFRGTWRNTDGPLLEMYVRNVMTGRAERLSAAPEALERAQTAEAAALRLAQALLLTPQQRARGGKQEGNGGVSGLVEIG